jgi:peptidyl-prolyl cis-trans isomerase A (cyclophilin A)
MKKYLLLFCLVLSFGTISSQNENPVVDIETELGVITVELYQSKAPITATNFLEYVKKGMYKNGEFYRVVTMDNQPNNDIKIEVIQGGMSRKENLTRLDSIPIESTKETGVKHLDGTISMARSTPGSATSEFFICVGDQPELDFNGLRNPDKQGFAAFGKVIEGMDVVHKIHQSQKQKQMLSPKITIVKMSER